MTQQSDLLELWRERDRRYLFRRRMKLSDAEMASIYAWRKGEVQALPQRNRAKPWAELQKWKR